RLPARSGGLPWACLPVVRPAENSVMTPAGVMRPIAPGSVLLLGCCVNQTLPSGPAVMKFSLVPGVMPAENSVTTPAGVIRPILFAWASVNQRLPSGPRVIPAGPAVGVVRAGEPVGD